MIATIYASDIKNDCKDVKNKGQIVASFLTKNFNFILDFMVLYLKLLRYFFHFMLIEMMSHGNK